MKLISCHINNFGNLSNKDYSFKDGINSFIQDNGTGKSTLAAFIKAMLFGLDPVRSTDVEFKDRRHYAPFNEQSYGGTLTFEHEKKEYRIERTFDVKSAPKDTLTIYVDKEEQVFEGEIGELLLGLDKESFDRLLFISAKDIEMKSNGNIRKNLNNIIDDTAAGVDYDDILNRLSEVIKKYSGKKNSATSELKERKKSLESQIANQVIISNSLNQKYEKRNKLNEELGELEKKQELVSAQNIVLECWNTYNGMLNSIQTKKETLKELESQYPKGYPTDEGIKQLRTLFDKRTTLTGVLQGITFDAHKLEVLNGLKAKYSNGVPTEEQMTYFETLIPEYNRVATLSTASSVQLSEEEKNIVSRFDNKNVYEDYANVETLVNEYKIIDDSLKVTSKTEGEKANPVSNKSKLPIILLITSILLVCVGIAMFFVLLPLGIALTVVGVIGLVGNAFLYLKNRIDSSSSGVTTNSNELIKLEAQLKAKEDAIHQILTPYGIYTQSIYSDFERFKVEFNRFKEVNTKLQESERNEKQTKEVLEGLEKEIKEFLDQYISYDDFVSGIAKLKEELKEYQSLNESYEAYLKSYDENDLNLKLTNVSIKLINDKYELGLVDGTRTLDKVVEDILTINNLKADIIKDEKVAEEYKSEKELGDEPLQLEQVDYSEQIKNLTSELLLLDTQIDNDEREIENLEDNRQTLSDIKETIKQHEHKFEILSKLDQEIRLAQKNLDDKYVAPIMEKFDYYSNLLGNLLGVKIVMGRDFNIILDINNKYKSDEHLSSGQRSICALCFRLALLDNIYNGNIPFIIMDDPFMTLDEKNLKATASMLKKLSQGKQIIYFSCHQSRLI